MKDNITIQKLYESLKNLDIEEFDEIYFGIRDAEYKFNQEDIVQLCNVFTHNYKYMEPHQMIKIVKMTFYTIDRYDIQLALKEFIKGLIDIYNTSLVNEKKDKLDFSYEDIIEEYISMFVNSYNESNILTFGQLMNKEECQNFKLKIIEILEMSMEFAEEDYLAKGNMLLKIIQQK